MKLAAVLACRNQSSRLYAKPLQNLDVENGTTILDFIIGQLKNSKAISDIVLAISEQEENVAYRSFANEYGIPFVTGSDSDVLQRLISGAKKVGAEHVFRVTTESPYCHLDNLQEIFQIHCDGNYDYSTTQGLPDGAYFEIIRLKALEKSWAQGEERHRSELCTLYMFENQDQFKIIKHPVPEELRCDDVRLTVDWPEDLIVLRNVYSELKLSAHERVSIGTIISYLHAHPQINAINNWIDSGIGRIWY